MVAGAGGPSATPRGASFTGTPSIRGSNPTTRFLLLSLSLIGIQFTWGVEMTYCTPYLLSLGLTKSKTSLVWVAGPLSGLIMQPVVGALSDKSTSKYGRRRPFMVVGSVVVGACLVLLGWTKEIVELFLGAGDGWEDGGWKRSVTVVVAVFSIYAIDFAINAVMAASRSIIIDTLPLSQQQDGSAWAARMGAAGSVVGYFIGSLDLVTLLPGWLGGDTQFKKMIVVALAGLWICIGITSWAVGERVLLRSMEGDLDAGSVWSVLPALWKRTIHLPPRIRGIVWAQFWGWIGWFPFMFYSSTWVGETYFRYDHPSPDPGEVESDMLGRIGQLGSVALVIFSIVTFASSVLLPYLITSPESEEIKEKFTVRPPPSLSQPIKALLLKASSMQPNLVTAWMISNLFFACIIFWAPFVRSLHSATLLVALCGIPWAITCIAPFAELGVEINKMGSGGPHSLVSRSAYAPVRESIDESELDALDAEESQRARRLVSDGVLRLNHPEDDGEGASTGELSGVYLGVLNVYTTLPQFVGTFISWIVFSILEPTPADGGKHGTLLNGTQDGPNAISVCLFIGSICAFIAGYATNNLRKMER
jgi:solute carrier family 45, member 1/2/4